VSRSDTTNDLAFCAAVEFNALADEVKAPFREEARKSCEAEIRAQCQKEDVTSEELIATTLRTMIDRIQPPNDPNSKSVRACRERLNRLMTNGRLFTDKVVYDVSHRPAGLDEINLYDDMNFLLGCIKHYAKADSKEFIRDKAKEVA